jgi:hypothetical protein
LEIENFQFAIATEAGALQAQSGMSQEQTEQTEGKVLLEMRNSCGLHCGAATGTKGVGPRISRMGRIRRDGDSIRETRVIRGKKSSRK